MSTGIFNQQSGYHNRRSVRLSEYDYSNPGAYYVTICTQNHARNLGYVKNEHCVLSETGYVAHNIWNKIPDEFIIMPNHVHGIIVLCRDIKYTSRDAIHRVLKMPQKNQPSPELKIAGGATGPDNPMLKSHSLSNVIRWFKGRTKFEIKKMESGQKFAWQPRFHDHIIRSDEDFNRIREYIINNPVNWQDDEHYDRA